MSMAMVLECAVDVHRQGGTACQVEVWLEQEEEEDHQDQRRQEAKVVWEGTQTTCSGDPTTPSDSRHRKEEPKTVDVVDGERIFPRCSASSAERWVTLPTCVPIQRCLAIEVVSSVVQEGKHANVIDHDHISTQHPGSFLYLYF